MLIQIGCLSIQSFTFIVTIPRGTRSRSGPNWCALRLLIKTKETSAFAQDGINWEIRIDDAHPEVIVNFVFEYALPKLPNWPTRQSVLPSNPR